MGRVNRFTFYLGVLGVVFLLLQSHRSLCAQPKSETVPYERSTEIPPSQEFRPVRDSDSDSDEVSGMTFMVLSYGVIWAFFFAYVLRVGRLQTKAQEDLDRLERHLADVKCSGRDIDRK